MHIPAQDLLACIVSLNIICSLYVWEMIYRIVIGLPLLAHHIVTILLIQIAFFDTGSLWHFRYGLLLCFYATTVQFSFVALYCYRLDVCKQHQLLLLRLAALQAVVVKTLVTGALVAYFVLGIQKDALNGAWGLSWKISFFPLLLILYGVQLYAVCILITIGRRCRQLDSKSAREEMVEDNDQLEPKVVEEQAIIVEV